MKTIIKLPVLLMAVIGLLVLGCKKKDPQPAPEFTKFYLSPSANPGLTAEVTGVIAGKEIALRIPNSLDLTQVKPSFEVSPTGAIVYVGSEVQQSGNTVRDLSAAVSYRIVSESGTTEYTLNALRNAAILTFGFYAEDNDGVLFKDYVAEVKGLSIDVKLPVDAPLDALVARFTTTAGATVKVGATNQESKVTKNNFTNPVTYALSDAESTSPDNFVVTVGRLTAPEWMAMSVSGLSAKVASFRLAIHPTTNQPYVAYALPNSAVDNDALRRKAVAAYHDGTAWKFLGSEAGFSANRSELTSIAIANNGVVYVAYKDFDDTEKIQNASVQKFENNSWSYVGAQQFTDHRVNHLYLAVGSDNAPVIGYVLARKEGGLESRSPYAYQWAAGSWQARPILSVSAAFFSRTFTGHDGKVYYVAMDMTQGTTPRKPTLLRLNNGTWETVGSALVSPAEDMYGAIVVDAAVAGDGTAYLVFQSQPNAEKKSFVMRYDGSKWEQIGDEINHTAGSNAERDNVALAIHPNGTLYFAHADATGLYVTTFNETTNNWNSVRQLQSDKVNGLDMKISPDGVVYLATESAVTGTNLSAPILYKFDIPSN